MILQALYEYYQRKAADPGSTIAPHGLEWKEIPYLILIDKKGNFLELQDTTEVQSAKPPVHLFKTKRFYFEVLFQNEASLLEQNQTAFKWTSNPI